MRRTSGLLAGILGAYAAAACWGQELPEPKTPRSGTPAGPPTRAGEVMRPAPPPAGQPGGGEAPRLLPPVNRPLYPPPLPAVVDPRTGAWRQVYAPPEDCLGPAAPMRVGLPCPRCGDKLRRLFECPSAGGLFRRHSRAGDASSTPAPAFDGALGTHGHDVVELMTPQVTPAAP